MPFAKTLHAIKSFTAIVLLYLTYNNALATNVVNIRTGSQTKNKTEIDLTNWKSRNADSAVFAGTNYNDSHWKLLNIEDLNNDDADGSVRWYRIHFIADSNMQNIPLAFFIRQFGSAAEFYLDGKLLKKSGVIGTSLQTEEAVLNLEPAHIIVVLNQKAHVLAIRCSDFHRVKSSNNGISIDGFTDFRFEKIEGDISDLVHYKKYFPFIFFTGLFVALFALHLVMYIFNRDKTVNAFYSMYCLGVAFISLYTYYIITSTSFNLVNSLTQIAISVLPLLVIPLVGLLHIIFYNKLGKLFITIICLYITLLLCMLFSGITAMVFTLILSLIILSISLVNIIAVIIKALKQGKDGARIFALVILLAPVMSYMASKLKTVALFDTLLTDINSGAVFTISLIISLPLSMTIYLARDMARMGKRLTKQLDEITNLSNKTIEQEQEKKRILENQNLDLERNVQQRTLEVVQQKAELEIKNKEITESLHYAKRIQAAILPPTELFTTTFADAFILYLPKDIVSGDFYAYAKKENNIIIAAADCTGHGVSGALMSMIGSSLLNQIVNEKNIIEPGHILNTLNEGIIDALKQRESTSHDGMDIAICQLNLQTLTLRFAGANRPLWLLRNHEIISYQPNKFPIGGLQILHDEVYAEHTIALQKNDVLYLFSDGYADQFGGLHEKKLLTKNLKNHILEIHHLPLSQQRESLLQTFNSWKGKLEQVDDVLVLAVKI